VIRLLAGHPTAANLLMVALIALGLVALPELRRETFPDFAAAEVEVRVPYPGASALEVEEAICLRLEDAVEQVEDIAELRCEARDSLAVMTAELASGGDIARLVGEIRTEVEAIDDLPPEVEAPVVRELGRTDRVVSVVVQGPLSDLDLSTYADRLKQRLLQAGVGSQITLQGFALRQIRVELSAQRLRQHGLGIGDVARAVERQSLDLPAGTLTTSAREHLIRFTDERRRVREIEDLVVVAGPGGAELRLGDLAHIEERFEDDESRIEVDGARAAILQVAKSKSQDSLTELAELQAFLDEERQLAPPGVVFSLTQDQASLVRDRLDMLVSNGAQGLVLVLLSMWLFFRLRYAFSVALALPVSFLGTLFVMALLGYSLNMMTLVALLIAIGLLVDHAVVIAENVARHIEAGRPRLEAAVEGVRQVAPGVTASFLTTICVFLPLAFLDGQIGRVLAVIPVVLITTLAVSFIEAFLILPRHLVASTATEPRPSRLRDRLERGFVALRERGVGPLVDRAVRFRFLTIGLVVGLFLASIAMLAGGVLAFRAFPDIEGDVIEARLLLPQGTPIGRTEPVVERITGALDEVEREYGPLQPGGALVRQTGVRYGVNADAFESGPHLATVTVDLLSAERRTVELDTVLARWREAVGRVPDVISLTFKEPVLGPAGHPIELRLQGTDLDELKAASSALIEWLGGYRGVVDLIDDLRPGRPELRLTLRDGALALGLDAATIAGQLRAAFFGVTAQEVQRGPDAIEIDLRLLEGERHSRAALDDFTVVTADGALVPLDAVARIEEGRGYGRIQRIDRRRTVTVRGDVAEGANAQAVTADTLTRFGPVLERDFRGVRLVAAGQAREAEATGASVARGFLLGLLGVYLLLALLFQSYVQPLVVLATIPMALIGVVWGHLAMGLELSMPSMVGFAALAGVVVNNAILLVAFAKAHDHGGMSLIEAACQASRDRFRAVVLTSLTTIAGLLPLLAETSLQAQVLIPLVASLAFGLLSASVLVLFVIPALYVIVEELRPAPRPAEAAA
jgi:hydrophobic/amphiphilic exporter-1 (mainly G- bacteria), HAE1 family